MASDIDLDIDENYLNTFSNCNSTYLEEDSLKAFFKNSEQNSAINLMHVNCRSINKNFSSLVNLLDRVPSSLTALGVSETWLTPASSDLFNIEGYKFVSNARLDRLGGGVGLYIAKDFTFRIRNDLSVMKLYFESIFVEIVQKDSSNVIIGCIYRPPGTDVSLFNTELLSLLNVINCKNNKMSAFIMGDFNLDLLHSDSHGPTGEFLNIMISNSFLPTICHPTRITETSATLIDNIFTNNIRFKMDTAIVYSDVSDHLPVVVCVHLQMKKNNFCQEFTKRVYSVDLIEKFKQDLLAVNWSDECNSLKSADDCNAMYNLFLERFSSIFNDHFPLRTFKLSKSDTTKRLDDWRLGEVMQ